MTHSFKTIIAVMVLCLAAPAHLPSDAEARAPARFSFDSLWFYRDGTRVVPEIGRRWITVVFDAGHLSAGSDPLSTNDSEDNRIQKRARAIVKSHKRLSEYLYDPNLAEEACFFQVRDGARPEEIGRLVSELKQEKGVRFVHPTLVLDGKTLAYFDRFEMEWKTGATKAQREALMKAAHVTPDEDDEKGKGYRVDVAALPFFRAINLLAEDIRVLRVTPHLVEIKPSIASRLSLLMGGAHIGDSIPFTLTITFSERVSIDPSSVATINLRPPELQKELFDCTFDPFDYTKAVNKSPIVITGRLRFYAPGEFSIPPVKVSYSCPTCSKSYKSLKSGSSNGASPPADAAPPDGALPSDGSVPPDGAADQYTPDSGAAAGPTGTATGTDSSVRFIETEPVLFKVSSMIPADKSENRLIVPTDPVPHDFGLSALHSESLRHLWRALASLAALLLCAGWLILLRLRERGARDRLREGKRDGELADQLRALLMKTPAAPHWSYLGEVGALLREYLVAVCGEDPRYRGGSGTLFMERVGGRLPGACVPSLSGIFAAIDASVCLESEHYPEIDQLQRDVLAVLDLTGHRAAAQGQVP